MGKRKKKSPGSDASEPAPTTSLGSLLAGMGFSAGETEGSANISPDEQPVPSEGSTLDLTRQPKLVLRMERKGRGGKTVTVLAQLRADEKGFEQLARDLRRALGCGARVEGAEIVLQGDVRDRARTWLLKRGVKKVVG